MKDRTPLTPPVIPPLPLSEKRPLWSVMIPCYNCSDYLRKTIESVLAQDQGPDKMQIQVVDDCSTDANIQQLVQLTGNGRVQFFRQQINIGSLRNFETCINQAKGQWIHILHGDDLVLPGFYEEIEYLFETYPEAGAAFTGFTHINELGKWLFDHKQIQPYRGLIPDWLFKIAKQQTVQPPAIVVKRTVYEKLGSFYAVHYGEDWEMWARIAAHYPVAYSPKQLAEYRIHGNNITSRYFLSGQSISDVQTVISIIQLYLPPEKRMQIKRQAERHFSRYFARTTDKIYHDFRNPPMAIAQARRAIKMHRNMITFYYFLKIYFKISTRYKFPKK